MAVHPSDWDNPSKDESPLLAGLTDHKHRKERHKDERPMVGRHKSTHSTRTLASKEDDERPVVEKHKTKASVRVSGTQDEEDRGDPLLLKQVNRMVVERVQHELSKVDDMIQERISKVDDMIQERVQRETQSLRAHLESLQRDVAWLRAHADADEAKLTAGTGGPISAGYQQPTDEDLASVNSALKKLKQGLEMQVSDLWTQVAVMQEGLKTAQLRNKLRFVATSMLALDIADLSQEERGVSKRALRQEEFFLQERLQSLEGTCSKEVQPIDKFPPDVLTASGRRVTQAVHKRRQSAPGKPQMGL
mmetsp:Transcript_75039/g.174013  ORF Transcript_75039/g.174013 Transcript_75039/m.174013 type:complete len:305 (-) Transcript_75039:84-998(-)|eukprot:CAMPEP_0171057220 /NCGR_PEP_ID=MMETSP0766_2-20121228/1631_1 /TAXON_ID=439317 /ORGANISM="Gambierdiscus australes, Strain CAWD 149" /LENGTH=304 /DNA_ID=CAMNT_0011512279 /DNA_START=59 /DNA_END=973 /DNA_ORIENTATION=-